MEFEVDFLDFEVVVLDFGGFAEQLGLLGDHFLEDNFRNAGAAGFGGAHQNNVEHLSFAIIIKSKYLRYFNDFEDQIFIKEITDFVYEIIHYLALTLY